jgi:hypothetical protein
MKRKRQEEQEEKERNVDIASSASPSFFITRNRNIYDLLLVDLYGKCCCRSATDRRSESEIELSEMRSGDDGLAPYDAARLTQLVRAIIDRSRTPDEYEISDVPLEVRHIHCNAAQLGWGGFLWSIEDFLALLLAADELALALQNESYLGDSAHDYTLGILQRVRESPEAERFTQHLLDDEALKGRRDELKCLLILYAIAYDTRVERLFCKWNNLHRDMSVDPPPPDKVLNLRQALGPSLATYISGRCSRDEFFACIARAYESGMPRHLQLRATHADRPRRLHDDPPARSKLFFNPALSRVGGSTSSPLLQLLSSHNPH